MRRENFTILWSKLRTSKLTRSQTFGCVNRERVAIVTTSHSAKEIKVDMFETEDGGASWVDTTSGGNGGSDSSRCFGQLSYLSSDKFIITTHECSLSVSRGIDFAKYIQFNKNRNLRPKSVYINTDGSSILCDGHNLYFERKKLDVSIARELYCPSSIKFSHYPRFNR
jgi:hypothetical protein